MDKTAFLASQRAWRGEDKKYWPTIANNILNRFEPKGYESPKGNVGWMHFGGKIVLDQDNHPVRDFSDIPSTLSSNVEPWLLEAISRIDGRIWKVDIRARMPWTYTDARGRPKKLCTLSAIGNRTMRFRETYGLIAWTPKAGSELWKRKVLSEMTAEQIANNTTEGLRTFTKAEIRKALAGNKGKYLEKAGTPRISDEIRRKREKKKVKVRTASTNSRSVMPTSAKHKEAAGSAEMNNAASLDTMDVDTLQQHGYLLPASNREYVAAMQAADARHTRDRPTLSRYQNRLPQKRSRDRSE